MTDNIQDKLATTIGNVIMDIHSVLQKNIQGLTGKEIMQLIASSLGCVIAQSIDTCFNDEIPLKAKLEAAQIILRDVKAQVKHLHDDKRNKKH